MSKNIIIWGTGERAGNYMKYGYFEGCQIIAFVDSYRFGTYFYNKKVHAPSELPGMLKDVDYIVLAVQFFSELYNECIKLQIPREKIIPTDYINEPFIYCDMDIICALSKQLYKDMLLNQYKLIKLNEKDLTDAGKLVGSGKFSHNTYMSDYFRYRTFEFAAEQIIEENIEGDLAEVGVFRGSFSTLINEKFPKRKLLLFDTFEGFGQEELKRETALGRCDKKFASFHASTSAEKVLRGFTYPEQCIMRKGFFPGTVTDEDRSRQYAFVSVDVDFEDSIYESICFFYPRLSNGGMMFIHDYNSSFLGGVKDSVKRYEVEKQIRLKKVPLADRAGTLVIVK